MTTAILPPLRESRWPRRMKRLRELAGGVGVTAIKAARTHVRSQAGHLREHFYSVAGFGCIDACAFVHSTFTGLLVTGVMFLVFEWKISEDES